MTWSWRIGRVAGIDLYVHFTFLLLLAWVALTHYLANRDLVQAIGGVSFILALFGIVVLHELGHALTARRFGISTRDIILLPIGGVARLERMPDNPKQELLVALAGPAVNVVLAVGIYIMLALSGGLSQVGDAAQVGGNFLNQLFWVNVSLAVFNLLPAFPMDGGRVLRAILAMRLEYVRATQVAATIGQGIAMLMGFFGLLTGQPILVLIALFVWFGAAQEANSAQMRSALDGIPVMRAMVTEFRTLQPEQTLAQAVKYLLASSQQDFPVVEDGRIVGMLTRKHLAASLSQRGPDARISETMQREFATASPDEMLQSVMSRLQKCDCHTVPVIRDGQLVGMITADNLVEVLMIQQALREASLRERNSRWPNSSNQVESGQRQPLSIKGWWGNSHDSVASHRRS